MTPKLSMPASHAFRSGRSAFNLTLRLLALAVPAILASLSTAWAATSAPEYALSGQAPELARSVLAQTPMGPVTALDVLMYDAMGEHALEGVPLEAWLHPGELSATTYHDAMRGAVERIVALDAVARRAGDWTPPADELRAKSFGAAIATWIEQTVKPQVKVLEADIDRYYLAHPEKYLNRQRAQVRYCFVPVDLADETAKQQARDSLEALAEQVRSGAVPFEEVARSHSAAPSAAQGGLLPPFFNGTFFPAFEDHAFQLQQPGQLSPVFEGPGGFYLLQLVQSWPTHNIPIEEARDEIRNRLSVEHVRHYYQYLMRRMSEHHYTRNHAAYWSYLNLSAPIAEVDQVRLTRPEFLRYYLNPTDAEYQVKLPQVINDTTFWTEGEVVMKDLEARALAQSPWIERSRQLAALGAKAQRVYAVQVPESAYATTATALATLHADPTFSKNLRTIHMLRFELTVPKPGSLEPAERRQAEQLLQKLSAQLAQGSLAAEPQAVNLAQWQAGLTSDSAGVKRAIDELRTAVEGTPWPNIQVKVVDMGWVALYPGSEWSDFMRNIKPGQVSPAQVANADLMSHYLIAGERPLEIQDWQGKPLFVQTLAFQLSAARIYYEELERLRQSGQIKFTF